MLKRSSFVVLAAAAGVLLFVCGCKSQNPAWDAENSENTRVMPRAVDDPGVAAPIDGPSDVPQTPGGSAWTNNPNELSNAGADKDGWIPADPSGNRLNMPVIYFAYDSDVLIDSEMAKIKNIAAYMSDKPELALVIEGHCDQRGTEEYNRALGERRANAIRAALESCGVAPGKMKTQSFGKDKPAVQGNDPAAWRQNRRGVPVPMLLPRAE